MSCFCNLKHQPICQPQPLGLPFSHSPCMVYIFIHVPSLAAIKCHQNRQFLQKLCSRNSEVSDGLFADLELFWLEENLLYKTVSLWAHHRTVLGNFLVVQNYLELLDGTPIKCVYILFTCKYILGVIPVLVMMQIFLEIVYLHKKLIAGFSPPKVNISQEAFCLGCKWDKGVHVVRNITGCMHVLCFLDLISDLFVS